MPAKTASEADDNFAYYLRESLSTITTQYLSAGRDGRQRILIYEPPVKLQRKSGDPLSLSLIQTYEIAEIAARQFKVKTTGYQYALLARQNDQDREIFECHWHPHSTPNLKWPHLHVNGNTHAGTVSRVHFPTHRLCIEDFIRLIMRDFGVKSRLPYDQCKAILTKNKASFVASASWKYWEPLI